MKKTTWILVSVLAVFVLAACGGGESPEGSTETVQLQTDYPDALSVDGQLALGTLRLDESEQAVDETQAAELLPLWQAYQALSTSDSAAEVEVTALLGQIQGAMTNDQIEAIVAMQLTEDDRTAYTEEFGARLGRGAMMGGEADGEGGGGRPGGGGFGGVPGMRPGGEQGGVPGGQLGDGGMDAFATRMAETGMDQESFVASLMDRALMNGLIRSLQVKTGELDPEAMTFRPNQILYATISESTGIPEETLQQGVADGSTLAEVITANDGDLEAVHEALEDVFAEQPLQEGMDLGQWIDGMLEGSFGRGAEGGD